MTFTKIECRRKSGRPPVRWLDDQECDLRPKGTHGWRYKQIKIAAYRWSQYQRAFNIKISLIRSKPNIDHRKKLVRCYVCSISLYGSEIWTLKQLERKYLESIETWVWRRMEKIHRLEKQTIEQVLERVGEDTCK